METTVKTNGHARNLVSWHDVPVGERNSLDYMGENERDEYRLFKYRGAWYDMGEFMRFTDPESAIPGWDGYMTDSAFSAVLIRWARDWAGDLDCENVVVGYAYC